MNDDEFRELLEMGQQIRELTQHPGWAYLLDRAVHTISSKQKTVLGGQVTSLEDYKKNVGWLEGANFVISLPERVDNEIAEARTNLGEREQ